jgi:hypothetical protein
VGYQYRNYDASFFARFAASVFKETSTTGGSLAFRSRSLDWKQIR